MRYTETCFKHNDGKHVLDLQEAVTDTFLFAIFKKKISKYSSKYCLSKCVFIKLIE